MWKYTHLIFLSSLFNFGYAKNLYDGVIKNDTMGICLNKDCITKAATMLNNIDDSVNPCDDFYQFACGNYEPGTDHNTKHLKSILTQAINESSPKHERLPGLYYKACMNTSLIGRRGLKPMIDIGNELGGWPLLLGDMWIPSPNWTWQELDMRLRLRGFSGDQIVPIIVFYSNFDSVTRLHLIPPKIQYIGNEPLSRYDEWLNLATKFGANATFAQIKDDVNQTLQFETKLKQISSNSATTQPLQITLGDFQKTYPYINWLNYLNSILPAGLKYNQSSVIEFHGSEYFSKLGPLLAETPKRVLANYLMNSAYAASLKYLVTGTRSTTEREMECMQKVEDSLQPIIAALYVRKFFKPEEREVTAMMIENIRQSGIEVIEKSDWLDNKTKMAALKKIRRTGATIGYLDEILDAKILAKLYGNITIDVDAYLESSLAINSEIKKQLFYTLDSSINPYFDVLTYKVTTNNAFDILEQNRINIPVSYIQHRLKDGGNPNYITYGSLGSTIGHEFMHSFDPIGRLRNYEGNLYDWWQPNAKKIYLERAGCVRNQYNNFTDEETGLKINGTKTIGDNIADLVGTSIAYKAYNKLTKTHLEELKLPGFDYSPQQMFWLSFAENWCRSLSKEEKRFSIVNQYHALPNFRVIGTLSNIPEFSTDFQCPIGSQMNPKHKCAIF